MTNVDPPQRSGTRRRTRLADITSVIAGGTIIASSFAPLFRRDLVVTGLPIEQAATDCSAWTPCPGGTVPSGPAFMDFSTTLRWLTILGAVVALVVPGIRLVSGRLDSRSVSRLQVLAATVLGLATALILEMVTTQVRFVGYNESNREFAMHPTWASAVMLLAAVIVLVAAVIAGRRPGRVSPDVGRVGETA
jgi:hypothetical protein